MVGHDVLIPNPASHYYSQHVIDDPYISRRHLRIYSVIYDSDEPSEVDILVYAEDLSSSGTYWNGSLIGRGNCGYLLSNDDVLKLSPNTFLQFQSIAKSDQQENFDLAQEREMEVSSGIPSG